MKKLLATLLLLALPVLGYAQTSVLCAPATPCNKTTGPPNTGTGMPLWQAFGTIDDMFGLSSDWLNTGTVTARDIAVTVNGVLQPQVAAEVAASVTPVNYGYPVLNVLRYGCDPTGTTDNSTCLNNANAVALHQTNLGLGQIFIPCGTYKMSVPVTFTGGVSVRGEGMRCTFIENAVTNAPAFIFGTGSAGFNTNISELSFSGFAGTTGVAGQWGLEIQNINHVSISHISVSNFPTALAGGILFSNASQFVGTDIVVSATTGAGGQPGIKFLNGTDGYLFGVHSDGNGGSGVWLDGFQGSWFVAVTTFNNGANGWTISRDGSATQDNINDTFVNCVGDTSANHDWNISNLYASFFVESWGSTQISTSVNTVAAGFFLSTNNVHDLHFTGGEAFFNNADGVQIFDPGGSAPFNIEFTGFMFGETGHGNGQAGTGWGLAMNGGVNHIRVTGGSFVGNITAALSNTATGTDICVNGTPIGLTNPTQCGGELIAPDGSGVGFYINAAASGAAALVGANSGGSSRWQFGKNGTAEGGSNAGSDFAISAFADNGTSLGTPVSITRKTGQVTVGAPYSGTGPSLQLNGPLAVGANSVCFASAPSVSSGGGTSPTVTGTNTCAFQVTEGTGPGATIALTMPAASNGWSCVATDESATVGVGHQISHTTTAVTVTFGTTPAAADKIVFNCGAF